MAERARRGTSSAMARMAGLWRMGPCSSPGRPDTPDTRVRNERVSASCTGASALARRTASRAASTSSSALAPAWQKIAMPQPSSGSSSRGATRARASSARLIGPGLGQQNLDRAPAVKGDAIDRAHLGAEAGAPARKMALLRGQGLHHQERQGPPEEAGALDLGVDRGAERVVPAEAQARRVPVGAEEDRGGQRTQQHLVARPRARPARRAGRRPWSHCVEPRSSTVISSAPARVKRAWQRERLLSVMTTSAGGSRPTTTLPPGGRWTASTPSRWCTRRNARRPGRPPQRLVSARRRLRRLLGS